MTAISGSKINIELTEASKTEVTCGICFGDFNNPLEADTPVILLNGNDPACEKAHLYCMGCLKNWVEEDMIQNRPHKCYCSSLYSAVQKVKLVDQEVYADGLPISIVNGKFIQRTEIYNRLRDALQNKNSQEVINILEQRGDEVDTEQLLKIFQTAFDFDWLGIIQYILEHRKEEVPIEFINLELMICRSRWFKTKTKTETYVIEYRFREINIKIALVMLDIQIQKKHTNDAIYILRNRGNEINTETIKKIFKECFFYKAYEIAKFILEHRQDIDSEDIRHAFKFFAENGDLDVVTDILVRHGDELILSDLRCSLRFAYLNKHEEVANQIIEFAEGETKDILINDRLGFSLIDATDNCDVEKVKFILRQSGEKIYEEDLAEALKIAASDYSLSIEIAILNCQGNRISDNHIGEALLTRDKFSDRFINDSMKVILEKEGSRISEKHLGTALINVASENYDDRYGPKNIEVLDLILRQPHRISIIDTSRALFEAFKRRQMDMVMSLIKYEKSVLSVGAVLSAGALSFYNYLVRI